VPKDSDVQTGHRIGSQAGIFFIYKRKNQSNAMLPYPCNGRIKLSLSVLLGMTMFNKPMAIALVAAATAIICTGLIIYFSPFHTCVRAEPNADFVTVMACASAAGGGVP
jgi:hypothetical protein